MVWINGSLISKDGASLSPFDHGVTVGDGIFETLQVVNGVAFAIRRHLERVRRSASGLRLPIPLNDEQIEHAMCEVITANEVDSGCVRLTITGGISPLGSDRGDAGATVIVASAPLPKWDRTTNVVTVPWPRNERGAVAGLKTTSYAENVVALDYAHERDGSEAIFANTVGQLCEGTGSNVFLVKNGRLSTPTLASGCLAGITRELLMTLIECEETDLPLAALAEADEAFLTSSTRNVQSIRSVNGHELGDAPGPITKAAVEAFSELMSSSLNP